MGLRKAFSDSTLRALEGKWVRFTVGTSDYSITEITKDEADEWWENHKPATIGIAKMNLDIKDLRNNEDVLDLTKMQILRTTDSYPVVLG
jgi:pyruvate,water dikinase